MSTTLPIPPPLSTLKTAALVFLADQLERKHSLSKDTAADRTRLSEIRSELDRRAASTSTPATSKASPPAAGRDLDAKIASMRRELHQLRGSTSTPRTRATAPKSTSTTPTTPDMLLLAKQRAESNGSTVTAELRSLRSERPSEYLDYILEQQRRNAARHQR